MNAWIGLAVLLGVLIVSGAIWLKPTGFSECVAIVSADIVWQDLSVTLDPRDVEASAARICAGGAG
jgi:hypothetical protein